MASRWEFFFHLLQKFGSIASEFHKFRSFVITKCIFFFFWLPNSNKKKTFLVILEDNTCLWYFYIFLTFTGRVFSSETLSQIFSPLSYSLKVYSINYSFPNIFHKINPCRNWGIWSILATFIVESFFSYFQFLQSGLGIIFLNQFRNRISKGFIVYSRIHE